MIVRVSFDAQVLWIYRRSILVGTCDEKIGRNFDGHVGSNWSAPKSPLAFGSDSSTWIS